MSMVQSRVRNCFCKDPKKEELFTEFRATSQAGDHQYIKANTKYFATPLQGGGGPVLVWPINKPGRIPSSAGKVAGHAGAVTDTDFHPFNQQLLVTGSADATVKLWQLPEECDTGMKSNMSEPLTTLESHSKRITFTLFHPSAANVLAVADFNKELYLWDVTKSDEPTIQLEYNKPITDVKWNFEGSLLGTTSKDQTVRLYDPRTDGGFGGEDTITIKKAHDGSKPSKMLFVHNFNTIMTFGSTKSARREAKVWDIRKPQKHIKKMNLDQGSGTLLPFYDRSTNLIYVGGKGDSKVRIMEAFGDDPFCTIHTQPRFTGSAKGYCAVPKRALDVMGCESMFLLRLRPDTIEPLHFKIPRKATSFQKDLFPDDIAGVPSMTAEEWFGGENKPPVLMPMDPKKRPTISGGGGVEFKKAKSRGEIQAELEAAKYQLRVLNAECDLYKGQLA